MVTDKRIGVLMGGVSAEREVSLRSGEAVVRALEGRGYQVAAIDVGKDICETLKRERVGVAFLVLHGGHGENGGIQGLLEVMEIPYTGSGILASALAMDKEAAKKVFLYHRIPVPPFVVLSMGGVTGGPGKQTRLPVDFGFPWVIKPVAEGSSIGVSIVKDEGSVRPALEQASPYGGRVIIEQYIEGKEVQVGILGERILGSVEVRPKQEFYSYEAKYTPGLTEYILPPEVDSRSLAKTEETALAAHRALGCAGATRVDLIIDRTGAPYLLEVNTIPGMTETSLLPKIARQSGLDFPSLVESILDHAIAGRETR